MTPTDMAIQGLGAHDPPPPPRHAQHAHVNMPKEVKNGELWLHDTAQLDKMPSPPYVQNNTHTTQDLAHTHDLKHMSHICTCHKHAYIHTHTHTHICTDHALTQEHSRSNQIHKQNCQYGTGDTRHSDVEAVQVHTIPTLTGDAVLSISSTGVLQSKGAVVSDLIDALEILWEP